MGPRLRGDDMETRDDIEIYCFLRREAAAGAAGSAASFTASPSSRQRKISTASTG
jgi:hypothetical protein